MAPDHAVPESVQAALTRAVAPMHKRALGMAVGLTAGAGVFGLTAFHIIVGSSEAANIELLSQYFYGYQVDWLGAFIGAWWGCVAGFVAGWFFAFVRNFVLATWLLFVRAKADLFGAGDFLDHI
jgi:hypothetical protein